MSSPRTLVALLEHPAVAVRLSVALLVAARLAPVVWLSPVLSLRTAPAIVRTGLLVALTIALTPLALVHSAAPVAGAALLLAVVREGLIGALFAIVTALPAHAIDTSGRLVDLYRGANLADVLAPPTGDRTSPTADLLLLALLASFAALGGVRLTLGALAASLVDLPVGVAPALATRAIVDDAIHATGYALLCAAAYAAPVGVAIVVAEASLGLVSRSVPRISVFFLGMPLRALLGLVVLLAATPLLVDEGHRELVRAVARATHMLR